MNNNYSKIIKKVLKPKNNMNKIKHNNKIKTRIPATINRIRTINK